MIRFFFTSAGLLLMVTCSLAQTASPATPLSGPPRVAVISTADTADLAALVTTELSNNPNVVLIERDALSKIGDELKLQQLAGINAVALGKLVGADGMLFLDKNGENFKARFTAVGLGYVLFDLQTPLSTNPEMLAKSLSDRVASFASKLKLTPDKAVPISLLNLRSDLAWDKANETELQLTLLLESRLAAIPEYVVLERRHADALGFEHLLQSSMSPELLKGAYLIDGSFRPIGIDPSGKIVVSLRIRSPKTNQDLSVDVKGSEKNIPELVNAIAEKIGQEVGYTGAPVLWKPQDEGREYVREADWAWKHTTPQAALGALDSATLLGDASPDLIALRIRVLCEMDSPKVSARGQLWTPPAPSLKDRVELIRRAMRDVIAWHDTEKQGSPDAPDQDIPVYQDSLDYLVIGRASDLLHDLEASLLSELTDSFRQELRTFVNFDPLHGKVPKVNSTVADVNPDDLANSAEEEMAFYRHRLIKDHVFVFVFPTGFCPRFFKNSADQLSAYGNFMQQLQADPNGRLPWLALSCLNGDIDTRDTLYPQFLKEFWNQREELSQSVEFRQYLVAGSRINADVRKKYIKQSLPLLQYWLTKPELAAVWEICDCWNPEWYPPEEVDKIWNILQTQRALLAQGRNVAGQQNLNLFAANFLKIFPSKTTSRDANLSQLTIDQYWCAKDLNDPDADPDVTVGVGAPRGAIFQFEPGPDGDGIWGLLYQFGPGNKSSGIFKVHLPDMTSELLDTECGRPIQAARTSKAFYVTYAAYGNDAIPPRPDEYYLKRYDLHSQVWTQRQLPDVTTGDIYQLNDLLYLSLLKPITVGTFEHGLARYDWDSDQLTVLVSSRRKPPQNQFDNEDKVDISPFLGPDHKPVILAPDGIYYIQENPGSWSKLPFDFAGGLNRLHRGIQNLIVSISGEVVLIDPDKPMPIPLMATLKPADWHRDPESGKMKREIPPWASQAIWKFQPEWSDPRAYPVVDYYDGHLYLLLSSHPTSNHYELLVFNPSQPNPVSIPLHFIFKGSEETADKILKWGNCPYNLCATSQGLCLKNDWGFWFVTYSDIDTCLKQTQK